MQLPNHVSPDHYLHLATATAVSHDDVAEAWEQAYVELLEKLTALNGRGTFYLVCGIQGAGKTTWINRNASILTPNSIFLDGPLPSRKNRERALSIARETECRAIAVWINAPLELALEQNSTRPGLSRILEKTIRRSYEQLEPPSVDEGFVEIIEIKPAQPGADA